MPPVVPLSPEDPAALGAYRLTGRLGPAVFTALSPSGEQVAVKRFPDRRDSRPDPDRVAALRAAAPIGTALVVDAGPGYVVTELVDGPSLDETAPVTGPALHRLAIATAAAVAALHQAGIVHGHVRPDQIVLGPDGPRLLCHGSPAPNPVLWQSPEELPGDPAGPPADLFGWAAVIVYTASGRVPFSEERVRHGAADLDPLEGDLRQLVADCLAPEPQDRPSARETLLRLIGHSGALDTIVPGSAPAADHDRDAPGEGSTAPHHDHDHDADPDAPGEGLAAPDHDPDADHNPDDPGDDPAAPDRDLTLPDDDPGVPTVTGPATGGRRRPSGLVLTAAGLAVALASGGTAYALTPRPAPPSASPATPISSGPVAATPSASATAAEPPATVHEAPGDPVVLTSYQVTDDRGETGVWTRSPSGGFQQTGEGDLFTAVSPGGRWTAAVNEGFAAGSTRQSVQITDRRDGERFSLPLVSPPFMGEGPAWSRDGTRLLLTVAGLDHGTGTPYAAGFLVVDPAARSVRVVQTANRDDVTAFLALPTSLRAFGMFRWSPDGTSVAAPYVTPEGTSGTRFWDLSGRVLRSMHWTGSPIGANDPFSPSGRLLLTYGCETGFAVCAWDVRTGRRAATVPGERNQDVMGWFDDDHLIRGGWVDDRLYRVVTVDLSGRPARTLAEVRASRERPVRMAYSRP
ncbi:hypothetical protein [Microbispora sp. ATCC PTA-5024]|uniref:hypothetical protein n=1 Tax=Microbispora sp. ATCC PTA-5024 TaxID=316330 RepID=UPI0003DBC613|nr:hypothetical protein [Microbispora sp. ATCC PTA-5024]ETK32135.1 hypothetical protein MPTA5024_31200 [Microbispora sp. ATCC PTA-5024]